MRSRTQRRPQRLTAHRRIAVLTRALDETRRLLHQDDLTPLLNRRGFRRACDRWPGKDTAACCVMIDLDGFKAINDRHGHPVGDAMLVHFAATLHQHMRPADVIARLGGDEFALILLNCSGDDVRHVLERLQEALAESPVPVSGGTVTLRFSAGVAERQADEALAQVLERADAALLDAKRQGKAMVSLGVSPARSEEVMSANTAASSGRP